MSYIKTILSNAEKELQNQPHVKYSIGISSKETKKMYLVDDKGTQVFTEYHYEIGSITKLFTGLLLSKAITEGLININESIQMYLPIEEGPKYPTIKEVVTHTAGLELEETEVYLPKENPLKHYDKAWVLNELNNYKRTQKKYKFSYSNLGAAVIGLILEEVYKKPYYILLNDLIKKIGLTNTYSINPKRDLEGVNDRGLLFGHWDWLETSTFNAAGCMVSTIKDMLMFGEYLLHSKEEYVIKMKETLYQETVNEDKLEMGMFLLKYPGYDMLYHDGGTGCFHSTLSISTKGTIVIALSNKYLDVIGKTFRYTYDIASNNN